MTIDDGAWRPIDNEIRKMFKEFASTLSTPVSAAGRYYDLFEDGKGNVILIIECPTNVKQEIAINASPNNIYIGSIEHDWRVGFQLPRRIRKDIKAKLNNWVLSITMPLEEKEDKKENGMENKCRKKV